MALLESSNRGEKIRENGVGYREPSIKALAANWSKAPSPQAFQPVFESQTGGQHTTSAMGQMIADLVKAA